MKYYRIAAWEKDENTKEVIVKADTREEALTQVEGAKAFLFPGEDTSNYRASVWGFTLTVNVGTEVPHYRITVSRPTETAHEEKDDEWMDLGPKSYEWIEKAEDEEAAKEKMRTSLREDGEDPEKYHIYADEMALEQCISEEELRLFGIVRSTYLSQYRHKYRERDMTVREYSEMSKVLEDGNTELYYEALKYFCKLTRMRSSLSRMKDFPAMSAKEIEELAEALAKTKTKEECDEILEKIKNNHCIKKIINKSKN